MNKKKRILTIPSPPKYNPNPSPKTPRKNPKQRAKFEIKIIHKKLIFFSISQYKSTLRHKKNNNLKLIYATKWKLIQSQRKRIEKSEDFYFFISIFHINNEVQLLLLRMGMFNKLNIRATLKIIETWMEFLDQKEILYIFIPKIF